MELSYGSGGRGQASTSPSLSTLPTVASGASAHTKGSWTSVLTDTKEGIEGLYFMHGSFLAAAAANQQVLVDVGSAVVGATANTEALLVANFALGHANHFPYAFFPIKIPGGHRVSLRAQAISGSFSLRMGVIVIPRGGSLPMFEGCTRSETAGGLTASSSGTSMTLPGATNTKGAWTVLLASTSFHARWVCFNTSGVNSATAVANTQMLADLGVGPAGSEQVIVGNTPMSQTASEQFWGQSITVPCNIPAGSRIVARYQANTSVAANSNPCAQAILFG